jgi:hypothetical protein
MNKSKSETNSIIIIPIRHEMSMALQLARSAAFLPTSNRNRRVLFVLGPIQILQPFYFQRRPHSNLTTAVLLNGAKHVLNDLRTLSTANKTIT